MSDDDKQVPEASTEPDIAEEDEKPPQLPFAVDYDKRGVAKCKVCKVKFDKGEFRLAKYGFNPFSSAPMKMYHHIQCLFETLKKARATTKKIDDVEEDIEDWDKIEEEDRANVLDALEEYRKFCAAKGIPSKTTPKKDVPNKVAKAHPNPVQKGKPSTESAGNNDKVAVKKEVNPVDEKLTAKDNSFREFRRLCANIADVSSYLAKTEEVKKFLTKGTGGDKFRGATELWVRLLLPGVIKRVYNLQSKQLVKLFAQIFNCNHEEMISDLESGDVAETVCVFFERSTGVSPAKKSDVTLQQVDGWLSKLEGLTKEEEQAAHLATVARQCTSNDLKMFVRLIKADLRINAGAKHILDGVHPDAYAAFQTTRNIGAVLQQAASRGGAGDEGGTGMTRALSIRANVLTAVLPMLAAACKSVEQAFKKCPNGMYAEIKYDGERVQLHKMGSEFKYFSRSLKPVMDHKVSHFAEYIPSAFPHGNDLILDAEVLLVDTNTGDPLPFGTLGVHKKGEFKDAKVCLFVFDCIHYNGENLMKKPLQERRAILQRNMTEVEHRVQFSEMQHIRRQEELRTLIARVLSQGLEGLVLKDVNSIYEPGKRHWLKVKKDYLADGAMADSADLVVLGAWYGTGKRGGMMSVFLMGCYDPDTDKWCTVSKVHTGHDDATLEQLQTDLRMDKIGCDYDQVPAWLKCTRALAPDFVASDPKDSPVWEITGAEFTQNQGHTADGISIRFPRVTKMRDDKTWKEATNLPYLKELFKSSKGKDFSELLGVSPPVNSVTGKNEQEEDASNRNSSDDKDHASDKDAAGSRSLDSDDGTGKKKQRREADKDDKKKNCENGKDEKRKDKMEIDDDAQSKNSKKGDDKTEKRLKQDNKETEKRSKEDDNKASKRVKGKEEDTDKRSKDKSSDRSEGGSRNSRRNRSPERRGDKRSRDSSGGGEDDGRERRKRRHEEQHSSGKVAKHE